MIKKIYSLDGPGENIVRMGWPTTCYMTVLHDSVYAFATVGRQCFREFLKSEFSEENIEFWIACEDYKNLKTTPTTNLTVSAQKIFAEFVAHQAPREVSLLKLLETAVRADGWKKNEVKQREILTGRFVVDYRCYRLQV